MSDEAGGEHHLQQQSRQQSYRRWRSSSRRWWWRWRQGYSIRQRAQQTASYMFGNGDDGAGRLGDGTESDELVPRRVEAFAGANVVAISLGDHHTMAIGDDGALFTFGWGHFNQLGHGTTNDELVPRR